MQLLRLLYSPWIPVACMALLAPMYVAHLTAPGFGYLHDDGIYLVTAKSLATNQGYRILSLPVELPQTKYPVLYPACLAVLWKMFPAFPQNLVAFRLLSFVFCLLWMWVTYKLAAEESVSRTAAAWILFVVLASPVGLIYGTSLMSETPFALLCTVTVLLFVRWQRQGRLGDLNRVAILALMASLAYHTRTIGITLVLAGAVDLVLRRLYRSATLFLTLSVVLCAPWIWWQRANPVVADSWLSYYTRTPYETGHAWNMAFPEAIRVVSTNLVAVPLFPFAMLGTGQLPPAVSLVASIAASALVVMGFAATWRKRRSVVHFWVLAFCGVMCGWAFPSYRFLVPLLPILLILLTDGLLGEQGIRTRWSTWKRIAGTALLGVALFELGYPVVQTLVRWPAGGGIATSYSAEAWAEIRRLLQWVDQNTLADSVVVGFLDPVVYLHTGRKSIIGSAYNPYPAFYGAGSGKEPPAIDDRAFLDGLRTHRVSYILMAPFAMRENTLFTEQVRRVMGQKPDVFRVVHRGANPNYFIVGVDYPRL